MFTVTEKYYKNYLKNARKNYFWRAMMSISAALNKAMDVQRAINKQMSSQNSVKDKITEILQSLVKISVSDCAALYATVNENYLEKMGDFIGAEFKSNIRYRDNEIGTCAAECRTINNYNKKGKALICVPIVRMHSTIGVIVLQKHGTPYSEETQAIVETLSLSLADFISSKDFNEYRTRLIKEKGLSVRDSLKGNCLNKGFGVGRAVLHRKHRELINIFAENIELEQLRLDDGRRKMSDYLDKKIAQTEKTIGNSAEIMEAYRLFAKDKGWYKKISADIAKGYTAEAAIEHVYEEMWNRLSLSEDAYLKEKLYDLRDVSDRLRAFVAGDNQVAELLPDEDIIIIAQTMGPADLMDYDYERIKGLVIEDGTPTMHAVIVAKALNIPVVAEIHGVLQEVKTGEIVALNGEQGKLYTRPSDDIIAEYQKKSLGRKNIFAELKKLKNNPNKTLDGIKINLAINYGFDLDFDYLEPTNCDGIGLYRTEIMYMSAEKMPNVEMQQKQYKRLFDKMGDKRIIFRTLDVGSDKLLPYWGEIKEDNPAIGWRSIRITLDRRAILRQQVRALLRAAVGKTLNIMFPMISTLQEFLEAKETVMLEYEREKQKKNPTAKNLNIGIMVEVPSIIFQLDEVLQEVDFISIGTNDLYQFTFACDRGNPRLSNRYDVLSAPFLRLMKNIIDKANQYKVYCSVCGEMSANPLEAMVLIGLGYRNFSLSGANFADVKKMILSLKKEDIEDYVKLLFKSNKKSLRSQLLSYAYDHGIAIK